MSKGVKQVENSEILIVDDMPDYIAFASSILKDEGYKVYAASSGKAALKFLEGHRPDLIVLDIKMSGMDGLEVCKAIKSNRQTQDIPVIFLTSEANADVISQGFEIGCCDYVVKPFVKKEYLARIRTHLQISRQSRELAAAYKELDMFCSAVSHDLKSPLNVISMLVSSLEDELCNDNKEEAFAIAGMIKNKSVQLTIMIERLLEFSHMCNIQPNIRELDLNKIFYDVFKELHDIEPERNIEMISGIIPPVSGDEVLIRLAVKNILSNAFKFTRKRKNAVIAVNFYEKEDYLAVLVKDNGAGFDMRYHEKLFKVFQRLHDAEDFEGSGIGLALVDRIMKRHGGKVSISGEVDKGAEICLYFKKYKNNI
ncbi:MAG: response regulator receiver sensor signal transduction histidine kinase [Oscillospiraceae bacterium]|jgi:CheY-like chemotaxis protein/anti-sigma regulatory factor (Ser/Thr protein kinase)|nr:response regulator receiver sensor signal transduction histidine kinase [Oscillospiraceae bacterium]